MEGRDMATGRGTFIAIEGTDGSGKGTQCELLATRLAGAGHDVAVFDFPQYGQPSSFFVGQYLNGRYGSVGEVGPYTASLFYALDRYQAAPKIREALAQGKVVLANRFVGSNMAHQGTKFEHAQERRGFFIWLDNLEFELLKAVRPAISLVLRVPAETAQTLVGRKQPRNYTSKTHDIHEADLGHMQRAVTVYDDMCQLFPNDFTRIDCTRNGQLLSIATVNDLIWNKLAPLLSPAKKQKGKVYRPAAKTPAPSEPQSAAAAPTAPSQKEANLITAPTGTVHAFAPGDTPAVVAAIAQFAKNGGNIQEILHTALADAAKQDSHLERRIIEEYGEGSVRHLTAMHLLVEEASMLLAGKIEQGRSAAYLSQLSQPVAFEKKNSQGAYCYYAPGYLKPRIREQYNAHMDQLFGLYGELLTGVATHLRQAEPAAKPGTRRQTKEACTERARSIIRPVVPLAAQSPVGIFASGEALEHVIVRLMSDPLAEMRKAGEDILTQAREVSPALLARIATPERGGAALRYRATVHKNVARLAKELLPNGHTSPAAAVRLTEVWPRNEFDLVSDILYSHSTLPLADLRNIVQDWPFTQKAAIMEAYIGQQSGHLYPGRALEKAHYSWDVLCDYDTFRLLQQRRATDATELQEPTPRYGYDMPQEIEDAGLADQFEACFDLSLRLYSILQDAGYALEAQYATLLGHKLRAKITYNAREAFRIHASTPAQGETKAYRQLVQALHEKIQEVHPLLAEAMGPGDRPT